MLISTLLVMKESCRPLLLQRRVKVRQPITGTSEDRRPSDAKSLSLLHSLLRPTKLLIFSPMVLLPIILVGFVFGVFYLLLSTIAKLYRILGSISLFAALFELGISGARSWQALWTRSIRLYSSDTSKALQIPEQP
jgi:hypothetical protein